MTTSNRTYRAASSSRAIVLASIPRGAVATQFDHLLEIGQQGG